MVRPIFKKVPLLVFFGFSMAGFCSCKQRTHDACQSGQGLAAAEINGASLTLKQLVLTFEDLTGDATIDVADFLKSQNIAATFFVTGSQIESNQEWTSAVLNANHQLASRGWSGQDFSTAPDPVAELRRADAVLSTRVKGNQFYLRSTGWNGDIAKELNSAGLGKYIGSISMDVGWRLPEFNDDRVCRLQHKTAMICKDEYFAAIQSARKGIINFRETTSFTRDLLKLLIPALMNESYSFAALSDIPEVKARLSQQNAGQGETCNDYN